MIRNVWVLLAIATFLLSAGWLMKSFPVLIFVGIAPLFALSDIAKDKPSTWNHLEVILLAFALSLFFASTFTDTPMILILAHAIAWTLAFAGYLFAHHNLGSRLGKFTIIFFWLGLEYLALKLPWRNSAFYLADALSLQTNWWKWNSETGYLSISLWILVVNLIFYLALFKHSSTNWILVIIAFLLIAGPIMYSMYELKTPGINRADMIALYNGEEKSFSKNYHDRGELITRSSAWVSVLIVLLALVKNKIKKK